MAVPLGTFRLTLNHLTGDLSTVTDAELSAICSAILAAVDGAAGVSSALASEYELTRCYFVSGVDNPSGIAEPNRIISAS